MKQLGSTKFNFGDTPPIALSRLVRKPTDDQLDEWGFNIMECELDEQYRVTWCMFDRLNLFEKYGLNLQKFPAFLMETQEMYNMNDNAYHNFEHGINGTFPAPPNHRPTRPARTHLYSPAQHLYHVHEDPAPQAHGEF